MYITSSLRSAVARSPNKPALVQRHKTIDYRTLDREARRLAAGLIAGGVAPGDRVALHMHNSFDLAVAYYACFYAGAIATPVNTRMKAPEIAYVLEHSGAAMYLGQPDLFAAIEDMATRLPSVGRFVTDLCELDGSARGSAPADLPVVAPDAPAVVIYTSGSTARPKGVVHTHRTFHNAMRDLEVAENDFVAPATPMVHVAGLAALLAGVRAAATVAIIPHFDPDVVLDTIAHRRNVYLIGMPVQYRALIEAQSAQPRSIDPGGRYMVAGDAAPPALKAQFVRCFGQPLQEAFGATETGLIAGDWFDPPAPPDSFGGALSGADVALIGDDGKPVPVGAVGEIAVRSAGNMVGYWNDPEATRDTIRNGRVHTGDLASRDANGFFMFMGRKKEIIVRGGSNISPQEVEAALYRHPGVQDAGVIGAPDPLLGERVVAYVSCRAGQTVTAGDLIAFAATRLANYKTPAEVIFLDELPKGPSGKVQRRALRDVYGAGPSGGVAAAQSPKPRTAQQVS